MSQNFLTRGVGLITTQTLFSPTPADIESPIKKKNSYRMDDYIRKRYGNSHNPPENWIKSQRKPGEPIHNEDAGGTGNVNSS